MEKWVGQIIVGDAIELIKFIPDGYIDMIFTDPPYGHNNNGDLISRREVALGKGVYVPEINNNPIANDGPEANDIFQKILSQFKRVLGQDGCLCCCCSGGGGPDPQFARWSLWIDEVLNFKQMVVWDKGPMGMGWHYRRSYETVLVAHKGPKCRWYDNSHKIENIVRHIRKIIPQACDHPTPKPVELIKHFLMLHTKPGDLVLDPFCGAGSTLVACRELGRRFIGFEIDARWGDMARNRLDKPFQRNMFADQDTLSQQPQTVTQAEARFMEES